MDFKIGDIVKVIKVDPGDEAWYHLGDVGRVVRERILSLVDVNFNGFNNPKVEAGGQWAIRKAQIELIIDLKPISKPVKESKPIVDTRTDDEKELIQIILG